MSWLSRLFGNRREGGVMQVSIGGRNNSSYVSINGVEYRGGNISISGDKVIIDGVVQDGTQLIGPIEVNVFGNIEKLVTSSGDVKVDGGIGNIMTSSGDVEISGNVSGNVQTSSGDVRCGSIGGNVNTVSGDIVGGRKYG